jgi:hypothetical protein
MELQIGDRVILKRLDNEDEEYYEKYLNQQGTVISNPEGRFSCVNIEFDNFTDHEFLYVQNLDKI